MVAPPAAGLGLGCGAAGGSVLQRLGSGFAVLAPSASSPSSSTVTKGGLHCSSFGEAGSRFTLPPCPSAGTAACRRSTAATAAGAPPLLVPLPSRGPAAPACGDGAFCSSLHGGSLHSSFGASCAVGVPPMPTRPAAGPSER